MKILQANRIAPDGTPHFAASHLGYSVCLCPIKGTPGLNELKRVCIVFHFILRIKKHNLVKFHTKKEYF